MSKVTDQSKIKIVPYGFDLSPFTVPAPGAADLRARFGSPIIFTMGRHVSYKGFDVLIRAMAEVRGDAQLVLGGEGPLTAELRLLAERSGVAKRVHFVGMVPPDQLAAYYQACDVFCLRFPGHRRGGVRHRAGGGHGERPAGGEHEAQHRSRLCQPGRRHRLRP